MTFLSPTRKSIDPALGTTNRKSLVPNLKKKLLSVTCNEIAGSKLPGHQPYQEVWVGPPHLQLGSEMLWPAVAYPRRAVSDQLWQVAGKQVHQENCEEIDWHSTVLTFHVQIERNHWQYPSDGVTLERSLLQELHSSSRWWTVLHSPKVCWSVNLQERCRGELSWSYTAVCNCTFDLPELVIQLLWKHYNFGHCSKCLWYGYVH